MKVIEFFGERLSELMFEQNNMTPIVLGREINVTDSIVRKWRRGASNISLSNALKLADFFNCSLEFLFGRSDNKVDFVVRDSIPFYVRLRQVMQRYGVTRYRIVKDGVVADSNISSFAKGGDPFMQTVIDLANYFGCTLDELVGRDK